MWNPGSVLSPAFVKVITFTWCPKRQNSSANNLLTVSTPPMLGANK
jgi:hypothetical protein